MPQSPSSSSSRHRARVCAPAAIAAGLLTLSGCGDSQTATGPQFAPPCPQPVLIRPAEDLTTYNGAGRDLTDLVLDGRITGLDGSCRLANKPGQLDVAVRVGMELTRGPAAPGRTLNVPYFVAVTEGDQILGKRTLVQQVVFPPNVDRVQVTTLPVGLSLHITPQKSGAAYAVAVGFQLTPEELQQNRARGLR